MRTDLKTFVSSGILAGMAVFCAASSVVLYNSTTNAIAKNFENRMAGSGETVSALADITELNAIEKMSAEDAQKSPLYLKYHAPMEKIARLTRSKYLYIFRYGGEKDISYIVDSSMMSSPSWAAPATAEESVPEDLKEGLMHAFREKGGVTRVIDDEKWGPMRSGTYPVIGATPRSFCMTGVDVTLGEIVTKSAAVMTQVAFVFVLISILAFMSAAAFSRATAKSVSDMKDEILRVSSASGGKISGAFASAGLRVCASIISEYVAKMRGKLERIAKARASVTEGAAAETLREALDNPKSDFDFFAAAEKSDFPLFCDAAESRGKFYAYCFAKSEHEVENILKSGAVRRAIESSDDPKIFACEICAGYAEFNGRGTPEFSYGEKIESCFETSENRSDIFKVAFSFAGGATVTGISREKDK